MMGIRRIRFRGSVLVIGNDRTSGILIIKRGQGEIRLLLFAIRRVRFTEKLANVSKHDYSIQIQVTLKGTYLSQPARSRISTG